MSDIITRLLLKTNDFDANLERSKGSVNSFQGGISNMAKSVGSSFMKAAGSIGLAVGAGESFMKIIRSTQSTSDEFDNTLNACKGTVDIFFQSLSSGSFEAFNNGVLNTISNLKELSALRDSLADAKLSMGFNNKMFDTQFTKFESVIRDTTKSREERENAFKSLQSLKDNFKVDVDDTLSGAEKELIQSLNIRTGRKDFNIDDIHKYISINNNDFSTRNEKKALVAYQNKLSEYDKQINLMLGNINATRGDTNEFTGETKKQMRQKLLDLKEQKDLYIQQNSELEKQNFLNQDNDVNRVEMIKNYEYTYDLKKRMYDFDKRTLELQNSLKSSAPKEAPQKDSIAWYDAEIAKLNKKLIATTDEQAKTTIKTTINELEAKKIKLQVETSGNSIEAINIQLADLNKKLISATDMQARSTIQATINELEQKKINLKFVVDQEAFKIKNGGMKDGALSVPIAPAYDKIPTHGKGGKKFKLPKFESPIKKKDIDINEEYTKSLYAVGSIMSSLSGITNESTAAYLQWGAGVVSSIAQAIPAIRDLITAKQTEAVINGVTSATETPVVGWLLAGAAVASVIAAMASIPKFATGGIVPGTSFTGDKVPALLNSGEMILNGSQQSNLFQMLNSGLYGSLSQKIAPSAGNGNQPANVTFRIHGRDLEGVLSNHYNQKSKVR
nr:MAG TPA: Putative tail length tape measure protein [Caudoviricetes sp.]